MDTDLYVSIDRPASPPPSEDPSLMDPHRVGAVTMCVASIYALSMAYVDRRRSPTARGLGLVSCGALAVAGGYGVYRPEIIRKVSDERGALVLPTTGIALVGMTGAWRSPLYFPSVILTAVGSARAGKVRGAGIGAITGAAYLAIVAVDSRRTGRWDRSLAWNIAMALSAYPAAGASGGLIWSLAVTTRSLEARRKREQDIVDGADLSLRESAEAISRLAEDLDITLLRVASDAEDDALDPEALREAIATNRAQIHHLTVAQMLIRTAGGGPEPDMTRTIDRLLTTYEEAAFPDDVTIDRRLDAASGVVVDARAADAALHVIKRGLDNVLEHADPDVLSRVSIECTLVDNVVRLTIADDGGGDASDRALWGTGLLESESECKLLGGNFEVTSDLEGVTLLASIPAHISEAAEGPTGQLAERARQTAMHVLEVIAAGNVVQGAGSLMSVPDRGQRYRALATFGALAAVWQRYGRPRPWAADVVAPLAMLIWPTGGLPPDGWACNVLADSALRHRRVPTKGAIAAAAVGVSARWRHSPAPAASTLVEKSMFPALGAALGVLFRLIEDHLVEAEEDLVDLGDRLDLLEQVAKPVRTRHDLVKPLQENPREWIRLLRTKDGQRLLELGRTCKIKAEAFVKRLATTDPVGDLHGHLADRLAPAQVTMSGWLPRADTLRPADRLLPRARARVALTAWAEDVGDLIREQYPPKFFGSPSLRSVHVTFTPESPDSGVVTVTLQPSPPPPRRRDAAAAARRLIHNTAALGGEVKLDSYDGRVSATLPVHVFAQD